MRTGVLIKVGGSLYDLPDLPGRLRTLIEQLDTPRVLLFPGGGAAADAVRALDLCHRLGEEAGALARLAGLDRQCMLLADAVAGVSSGGVAGGAGTGDNRTSCAGAGGRKQSGPGAPFMGCDQRFPGGPGSAFTPSPRSASAQVDQPPGGDELARRGPDWSRGQAFFERIGGRARAGRRAW